MKPEIMVNYLVKVSNGNIMINFFVHMLFFLGLMVCFILWKKDKHKPAFLFSQIVVLILTSSVVINAIYYGNPFHIVTFILLIMCGIVFQRQHIIPEYLDKEYSIKNINIVLVVIILLGIWYPEFTKVTFFKSILFSPLGVVPCPTLLSLLGFMCLFRIYFSKKSIYTVIVFAFIYGIIGTFVFRVYFDILLLVAASFSVMYIKLYEKKRK